MRDVRVAPNKFDLRLVKGYSDLSASEIAYAKDPDKVLKNKLLLFIDSNTRELFKYVITERNARQVSCNVSKILCRNRPMRSIELLMKVGDTYKTNKGLYVNEYFQKRKIDLDVLDHSSRDSIRVFAISKLTNSKVKIGDTMVIDIIVDKVKSDEEPMYANEFMDFVKDLYEKSNGFEILDSFYNELYIRYILGRIGNPFVGNFEVYNARYTDNKNKKTFDTINLEILMSGDYNRNLEYVKTHISSIKRLLKYTLETHKLTKDYANYLKLYSFTLTRENLLVAKFCFKDGLEYKLQ